MISLKDWNECVNYRISDGTAYCWGCYGGNAYTQDSWDGDHDGVSSSITFDTKTQTVYEVSVYDYSRERAYRLINPAFKDAHKAEAENRSVDDCAWDGVEYIDLETDEDFVAKCKAIMNYEEYDLRVSVPLDIPKDDLFEYMLAAHNLDMTLNQFVEEALLRAISEFERDPEGMKARAKEFVGE